MLLVMPRNPLCKLPAPGCEDEIGEPAIRETELSIA
jgi:hypothetical protein